MDRFVCIHGHFYQPPRENPWLEAVETQDTAHPYHDWNERITVECYAPNASARIMDARDRIVRIVNNYAWISFNFGPTLLSWLEEHAPDTYAAIIDADAQSRERFSGHGSAIAQVYNHVILPLANARDQRTQVRWGVRDFEHRFHRRPEGMWLPETAIDVASLEALADEGITFTILEPHQVKRFREIGKEWTDVNGTLDPTMPYVCNLPSGRSIAIFFYDGPISRAVAFEKLLARGEQFAHRLGGAFSDSRKHPQLVNIATDGETYGHHHRFGDMALAYALQYIEENKLARITNYGEFIELFPPTHEVEIAENTAWSCSHGLERWRSDCGCSTGADAGWNQQWRGPLRRALDWLRDEVAGIFESVGGPLMSDPWKRRDAYIDVVLDRTSANVKRFLSEHAPGANATTVLELLEMQRNAMLMFTSCGWFFNDISGIETVQVLHYAGRVIQLAEKLAGRPLEPEFLERISTARSNLPEHGTARQIYEREVAPARLDLRRVAAHYAVRSLFDSFEDEAAKIYCYTVTQDDSFTDKAGRAKLVAAKITVRSQITMEQGDFAFAALHLGETELTGGVRSAISSSELATVRKQLHDAMEPGGIPSVIRLVDQHFNEMPISIRSLFRDEQRRILRLLCNTTLEEAESALRQLHERYNPLMRFHARLGIPLPKVLLTAAEFDLNLQLRRLLEGDPLLLYEIESRLNEAREERVALDDVTFMSLKGAIERTAETFRENPGDLERLEVLENFVSLVRGAQLHVNMRRAQNDYYRMKTTVRPRMVDDAGDGSPDATRWLELFDALGDKLLISPEAGA